MQSSGSPPLAKAHALLQYTIVWSSKRYRTIRSDKTSRTSVSGAVPTPSEAVTASSSPRLKHVAGLG